MKNFIALLILFGCVKTQAQQLPLFSQYYFNSFVYNPSHTGAEQGTGLNFVARKQFLGLANSMGTYAATLQTRGAGNKSGFGFYMYNDNVNLFRTNSLTGSYAYHIPLQNDKVLSFGIALSALDHKYNASNFNLISESDPIVALIGSEGGLTVDANAGVNMDFGKLSMGLANLQMFKNQDAFKNNGNIKAYYTLASHWMFNAGYKIELNEKFELEPYLLYRKTAGAPGQADINLFLNWMNKGYAGLAYRDGMSFSTMLGINLNQNIALGYAFDATTHKLRTALGNTHEVSLRFKLNNKNSSSSDDDILAKNKKIYQDKIYALQEEVYNLKSNENIKTDTIVKVVVKEVEVIKEVPVIKEVIKEVPVTTSSDYYTTNDYSTQTNANTEPVYTHETTYNTMYYIIAGSFVSSSAAANYMSNLSRKGHQAYQKLDPNSGRYYVHLGQYNAKSVAAQRLQRLKSSGLSLWLKAM